MAMIGHRIGLWLVLGITNCVRHRDPLLRSSLMRDSSMRSIGLEPPAETPSGTASAFEPRLCSSQKLPHED